MQSCGMTVKDISPAGIDYSHIHKAGNWMFSYSYMNSMLQHNYSGSSKISDQKVFEKYVMLPVNMQMDMHMLMSMYGITDKLSLICMFSYIYMNMDMTMLSGEMNMDMGSSDMNMSSTSQGFGDTKITAVYSLYSSNGKSLIANVGISVPTGSINKTEVDLTTIYGDRVAYMMQTGSGTFDFLPGISYIYRKMDSQIGFQAESVIHSYYNHNGYKLGNELDLNSWAAYSFWKNFSCSFRLNYELSGKIQGADPEVFAPLEPDADPKNYGGSFLNGFIGANYFFYDDFLKNNKIAAEFGIPIYQNYKGIQEAPNYNLIFSWSIMF